MSGQALCNAVERFTFAYIFAAAEPGTDNVFALVMPHADTETMQVFLDRFSGTSPMICACPKHQVDLAALLRPELSSTCGSISSTASSRTAAR